MPYVRGKESSSKIWPLSKAYGGSTNKKETDSADSTSSKPQMTSSRDDAIQQVKDILSTSPQLSTSPRRKSAPELYSKKHNLKVDLPLQPFSKEMHEMPCILRKKSGEVVKPSLKKGNSKSEPTTPTFPKYVHFNADLEQVKLFNEAQRPQAVSADASSEEESDDDDDEFDFNISDDDDVDDDAKIVEEPELTISLPNMPMITTMHSSKAVFLESAFLSQDKKSLQGRIMVQNISFQKIVDIRYTFDFWSSVSEVSASYAEGVPSKENRNSFDLFVFSIELIDNSRNPIDGKTMYFAVRYNVDGRDIWDNNNGSNYQVNFKRVSTPAAPKSISKKNPPGKSQNVSSSWSSMSSTSRQTKNLDDSLCRSPPTLNSSRLLIDSRKKLLGRYDIGVSLSAAQNAPRPSSNSLNPPARTFQPSHYPPAISYGDESFRSFFPGNYIDGMPGTSELSSTSSQWDDNTQKKNSNPIAIPSSKPVIGSSSYYDLVNQYCFYSGSPYAANSHYASSPPVVLFSHER